MPVMQRSFEDLGTPLFETTFVIVDLETTGGSPTQSAITEIGAVKVRGGDVLGEFQTLVNPGSPIPPFIESLTGITNSMVANAVTIDEALPSFLEFMGDAVLVAHNAGFDTRFLRAESTRLGYGSLDNSVVCTVKLARRLVRDEVPNLRLETLSRALNSRFEPCHRALADARATTEVLHALLELAGRWGVKHLDDLLWFQTAGGHPQARKRVLTESLPRSPGVYLFRDRDGRVLYVGKATDLRTRVRSYFGADDRRAIGPLLREMDSLDHIVTRSELESLVLEARLIRKHRPRHNRVGRGKAPTAWVRLTDERFPRVTISRTPGSGIGPLTNPGAQALREALESAAHIRRCTERIGPTTRFAACALAQIGRCPAPCEDRIDPDAYGHLIAPVLRAVDGDPREALGSLHAQMTMHADGARFEEAASTRGRIGSLVSALLRQRAAKSLVDAGTVTLEHRDITFRIEDGRLMHVDGKPVAVPPDDHPDEPRLIASWLAKHAPMLRSASGVFATPVAAGHDLAAWQERLRRSTTGRG